MRSTLSIRFLDQDIEALKTENRRLQGEIALIRAAILNLQVELAALDLPPIRSEYDPLTHEDI